MRIGTDIIEIDRIQKRWRGRHALPPRCGRGVARYGTMKEHRAIEFLAGRFAAKEAYVKALEAGIGGFASTDMSIANKPSARRATPDGRRQLSISHSDHNATATV